MNLESARSHFCEIENLINQVSKVIGRRLYALNRFHLSRRELPVDPLA
jgi:hypothetical protein